MEWVPTLRPKTDLTVYLVVFKAANSGNAARVQDWRQ